MSREIKFKAWVPEKNAMVLAGSLDYWFQACLDTGINPLRARPATIMLEYTNIKDVNGVEVYEGDIVSAIAEEDYSEDTRVSDIIQDESGQWQARSLSYSHGLPLTWGGWLSFEVIGNIYENPELLK